MLAVESFCRSMLGWYDTHGRKNLPWHMQRTPYRVWISEIMLQQTQVPTVTPFFLRFIDRFPDVQALAEASLEQVMELWSGLGYYARARNLHQAARTLARQHGGAIPPDRSALLELPGIGRSTAGAILSLGHGIPAAILDGNVKRVLCRYWRIHGWPGKPAVAKQLWSLSEQLTPTSRAGDYNQAMMDLGAIVCLVRRPNCSVCPLAQGCSAYRYGETDQLPAPKPKRSIPSRESHMLLLRDQRGKVYLEHRPPTGFWGGLWSFPMFAEEPELFEWCAERSIEPLSLERLQWRRHTFSHFHLDYLPILVQVNTPRNQVAEAGHERWCTPGVRPTFGLPAPVRRLLDDLGHRATSE